MPPGGRRWLALVVCLWLLLAASPAFAACIELVRAGDDGIGGMGLAGDDDGIGGMGRAGRPSDYGIAVYGTITGFGSVCVNGLRIELPESLREGGIDESLASSVLAIGHVVSIDARVAEGTWVAEAIDRRPALSGSLDRVADDGGSAEVLGVRIDLGAIGGADALAGIEPGESVVVYGLRGADRTLQAARVERGGRELHNRVWGIAKISGEGTTVGGVEVAFATGGIPREGDRVVVSGDWSADTGRLERARWNRTSALLPDHPSISAEVVVERTPSGAVLLLDGQVLAIDGLAIDVEAFATGERIWLKGRRLPDGSIEIQRLDRQPPGLARGHSRGNDMIQPGKSADAPGHAAVHPSSNSVNAPNSTNPGLGHAGRAETTSGIAQRPEKPARVEKPERPPRPPRPDVPDRLRRPSKPEKKPRPERPDNRGRNR